MELQKFYMATNTESPQAQIMTLYKNGMEKYLEKVDKDVIKANRYQWVNA